MPATTLLDAQQADPQLAGVLAAAEAHFGQLPNLVRALSANPAICRSVTEFLLQMLAPGRLDWPLKELLILKTLRATTSYYGYGAHERLALELGVPTEKIGDLANSLWRTSPRFDEGERALLELVERIARDANDVGDELWRRLHASWDAGQLLEATALVTTFVMVGRLGDALGVSDPVLFTRPAAEVAR